ncbi:exodeoxyribonuclease VII large subunit [Flammeovirga sp. MY04]|uniref:exodeoxyribonuclease VII large subunit n=1 Tax=Flammeovirga sp. MY04 TaxID=1191459 RepID=UPI000825F590|nr:exodeoxyribonuclease VII large subunit [Flammeovirga sp. MY04]ANQ48370.2 exodeoxyribonuclease VII large subunit [Flammeovirga sp. MY04]
MMSGNRPIYKLSRLNESIAKKIGEIDQSFWIKVEISNFSIRNGHVHLEIIEKDDKQIIAKQQANIWSQNYLVLKKRLGDDVFDEIIKRGSSVVIEINIQFHSIYGLSLNVIDIDENHSLGELERLRRLALQRLASAELIDKQKSLKLPLVFERIAIISSPKAAGYEDFMEQLRNNDFGYQFTIKLFDSEVQGSNATKSIIKQIHTIQTLDEKYDAICIIRGGGSKTDLLAFDNFDIGEAIALCTLPVITGIGHERDESIADIVANRKEKTPTAAAQFIITRNFNFEQNLMLSFDSISNNLKNRIQYEQKQIELAESRVLPKFDKYLYKHHHRIEKLDYEIRGTIKSKVDDEHSQLKQLNQSIKDTSKGQVRRENQRLSYQKDVLKRNFDNTISNQHMLLERSKIRYQDVNFLLKRKINNFEHLSDNISSLFKSNIKSALHQLDIIALKVDSNNPENIINKGYTMTLKEGKLLKKEDLKEGEKIQTIGKGFKIESLVNKID